MNMDEPLGNDEILKLNILLNSFLQGLTLNDINIGVVHTMKVQAGDACRYFRRFSVEL